MVAKDNRLNFIKSAIENLPIPLKGTDGKSTNLMYYDTKQKGLFVIIFDGGSKTFYVVVKINGRPQRIKLGKFPDITIEQARKLAVDNTSLIN